jgi:SAM-dependent methyltransferase
MKGAEAQSQLRCPICRHPESEVVEQLTGAQLKHLWKKLGHEFTPEAWGRITDDFAVARHRCQRCGFEYFDPALAGNDVFYQQLEHETYFSPVRAEFRRTVAFTGAKNLKRVLDVGCGSGSFLNLARDAGCQTFGLELNPSAAEKARAQGHTIFSQMLEELDREKTSGGFDLITFFQVLEHVRDPVGMLVSATALLNPRGYISIAVPAAEGIYRFAFWDPHQWPPHHVSHWRLRDFTQLARAAKLRVAESGSDRLLGTEIENLWKLRNRLAPVLGHSPRQTSDRTIKLVSILYRKTGMKFLGPKWGSSIYAYFTR